MRFPWMKEVSQQDGKLRQVRAQTREFLKLTHRHHPAMIASESPHDCCFGIAPRLLTPTGQKPCFWPNWLTAVVSFRPSGSACALSTHHPQLGCALYAIVHRTSNIVHRQSLRGCLGPSCVLYIIHRRHRHRLRKFCFAFVSQEHA